MDFQRIRYFTEVARQKNFSRAAKICNVSQPSLSQQIKKLEEEIGGALFLRTQNAIMLTQLGSEFLKYAQAIMAEVETAEEFVTQTQQNTLRTIRIGAIPTIAPYMLPDIVQKIRKRHERVKFELIEKRTEMLVDALQLGTIDFALMSPPTAIDDQCDHISLLKDSFLLALPNKHPLADFEKINVKKLTNERILLLENSHCLAAQVEAYCENIGLNADITIRSTQMDTLLGLVESGLGLTFIPSMATGYYKHRKVQFRPVSSIPCHREVWIMWLRRQVLTRSQHAVIDVFGDQ